MFVDLGHQASSVEWRIVSKVSKLLGLQKPKKVKCYLNFNIPMLTQGRPVVSADEAWVPARNTVLMALAGSYAQVVDADAIAIGYGLFDNFVFGDNDIHHHRAMANLLTMSLAHEIEVLLPIKTFTKAEVIRQLVENSLLDYTTSCWCPSWEDSKPSGCGNCANCKERSTAVKDVMTNA